MESIEWQNRIHSIAAQLTHAYSAAGKRTRLLKKGHNRDKKIQSKSGYYHVHSTISIVQVTKSQEASLLRPRELV